MTVNELIQELTDLANLGHGDATIVDDDGDEEPWDIELYPDDASDVVVMRTNHG